MDPVSPEKLLEKMESEWDQRARENARFYVASGREDWSEEEFYRSGQMTVEEEILTDMTNICQGRNPKEMKVLEIGCGAGRVTRALAAMFGEVHAVDVSSEMVDLARRALAGYPNAHIYKNNGMDLSIVPGLAFDFAFSSIVFQHIPSREIIENYIREVHRLLRPGALFKFQVQGCPLDEYSKQPVSDTEVKSAPDDTWLGVPITDQEAVEMALRCGFDPRYRHGAGEQYFWLWYFKRA